MVTEQVLKKALPANGLFRGDMPWLLSPRPLELDRKQVRSLESMGHILGHFYDACNTVYHASAEGREHGWLAGMLDAGKPEWLIQAQRSKANRRAAPRVIRPDLMLTDGGWKITELDSVPGGQGVTAFLSNLYADAGWNILGGADGMAEGFKSAHPEPFSILVSEESSDYMAEMEYFASLLGEGYSCGRAEDFRQTEPGVSIYRFFELFDTEHIGPARDLVERSAQGVGVMSPPAVPHLEEKMWLALFHNPGLQRTWSKLLRGAHREQLLNWIPKGWVVDPAPIPPHAVLPWLNVNSWDDVAGFSQKERNVVLKISGFNALAWGARGVHIGHDMPSEEWNAAVNHALLQFDISPWVMQEFHPGAIISHPYYDRDSGEIREMEGRARVCPYYYRTSGGKVALGGVLATIVPKDKKKIHGMKDGILVPCTAV